jgi:enamine deaminase RidA (YjgF/YER057c/UK114 family)
MSHLNGYTVGRAAYWATAGHPADPAIAPSPEQTASVEPTSSYLSSAVEVPHAGLIFVSGMCGQNEGKFIEGTVKDRTVQALRRVEALLGEKGLDLTDGTSSWAWRPPEACRTAQ